MKILAFLFLLLLSNCSQLPSKNTTKLSILQGVTNLKEVEFSVLAQRGRNLRFELRDEDGEILLPVEQKTVSRDFSDFVIHKVLFGRDFQKIYNLFVFEGVALVDQRLIGRGQKEGSQLRLAVASCLDDTYSTHFKIWETLTEKKPEYLLLLGDNVYATKDDKQSSHEVTPETLWNRNVELRTTLPFFYQEKLIPTHAIWDDNDYGQRDGDEGFAFKEESRDVFNAFWAQDLSGDDWSRGHGTGGILSLGDFNLYFLDARSFRASDQKGLHLGSEQSAWLYSKLKEEETPSFIIKGDQFFGGHHQFESYEGRHPEDFKKFVTELRNLKTPLVFLSGDRHMSEIMQFPRSLFGRPSFEITSSPLHGRTFESESRNPWQVVATHGKVNFTLIDNVAKDNHWFMDVTNIGESGEVYYRRELAVYIKDLQDNLKEVRRRRSGKRRYRKIRSKRGR